MVMFVVGFDVAKATIQLMVNAMAEELYFASLLRGRSVIDTGPLCTPSKGPRRQWPTNHAQLLSAS